MGFSKDANWLKSTNVIETFIFNSYWCFKNPSVIVLGHMKFLYLNPNVTKIPIFSIDALYKLLCLIVTGININTCGGRTKLLQISSLRKYSFGAGVNKYRSVIIIYRFALQKDTKQKHGNMRLIGFLCLSQHYLPLVGIFIPSTYWCLKVHLK